MITTRTSRADKNYLSWSGDTLQWYLGTDRPEPCLRVPNEVVPHNPAEWDSALKVSLNPDIHIYVERIIAAQCRENVLDINHSHGITFKGVTFGRPGEIGEQVITIKGGSSDVSLSGCIASKGTNSTIVLGQWADQSTDKVREIDLTGLYTLDGSPITIILVRVDHKSVKLPTGAKVLWGKSLAFKAYWWLKLAAVKLHLIKSV